MPELGSTPSSERKTATDELAAAATLYAPSAAVLEAGGKRARAPMSTSSRFVLLAAAGLGTIIVVVVLAIVLRSPGTISSLESADSSPFGLGADGGVSDASALVVASAKPPVEAPVASRLSADELDGARSKGALALATLAERYPDDPALLTALVVAYGREKPTYLKAMSTARHLFAVAPEKAKDPDVERVMLMVANGPVDVATTALEIMAGSMGSHGPELLYELVLAPGVGKFPKERAARLLLDPSVKKIATPALVIANDLRLLPGCSRRELFGRAATDGDERTLAILRPMLATKGCAWHRQADCFACLGDRAELRTTIETIAKRLGATP